MTVEFTIEQVAESLVRASNIKYHRQGIEHAQEFLASGRGDAEAKAYFTRSLAYHQRALAKYQAS